MTDEALKVLLDLVGKSFFGTMMLLALAAAGLQGLLDLIGRWIDLVSERRGDEAAENRLTRLKLRYEIEVLKQEHRLKPVLGDDPMLDRLMPKPAKRNLWITLTKVDTSKLKPKRLVAYEKVGWIRMSAFEFGGIYSMLVGIFLVFVFQSSYAAVGGYIWQTHLNIPFTAWMNLVAAIGIVIIVPMALLVLGIALVQKALYIRTVQAEAKARLKEDGDLATPNVAVDSLRSSE